MSSESKHNKVGILRGTAPFRGDVHKRLRASTDQSIYYMLSIWIVTPMYSLTPDVIHDLVLAFTWDAGIRNDHVELKIIV
jgi:hypothetical protein